MAWLFGRSTQTQNPSSVDADDSDGTLKSETEDLEDYDYSAILAFDVEQEASAAIAAWESEKEAQDICIQPAEVEPEVYIFGQSAAPESSTINPPELDNHGLHSRNEKLEQRVHEVEQQLEDERAAWRDEKRELEDALEGQRREVFKLQKQVEWLNGRVRGLEGTHAEGRKRLIGEGAGEIGEGPQKKKKKVSRVGGDGTRG